MRAIVVISCVILYSCRQASFSAEDVPIEQTGTSSEPTEVDVATNKATTATTTTATAAGLDGEASDDLASQTDEFSQEHKGVLDILLVIDNSSSMGNEQDKLSHNLPDLLKHVSGSDWQIAVIGTKINDCLSERITKATPNYQNKYRNLIKLGAQGDGEYHFYQARQGLQGKCQSTTSKWLRQESSIAVLIVSDQFNECHGYE